MSRREGDPLALPATPDRIRRAVTAAGLPPGAMERALAIATATPAPDAWRRFLSTTLAAFGAGLLLSGAISFIAYNWDRIGRYGKFALVELAIAGAAVFAWRRLPALSGQIALFSAAVLVGPLLALFGQTYQTGADPWGLFLTWAVLVIPWALAARFGASWLLVLMLFDVASGLWVAQILGPRNSADGLVFPLMVGAMHAAALGAWEWQMRRPTTAILEPWVARVVATLGFIALFFPATYLVVEDTSAGPWALLGAPLFVWAVYGSLRYYAQVRRDRFMLTLAGVAGMALVTVMVARVVFDLLDLEVLGLFAMAAFVVWQITVGLKLYRGTRAS